MINAVRNAPNFYKALLLAGLEGFTVISVELMGTLLIVPYYGQALYTWAGVIGITLLSLTTGYFIGGRLAVRSVPVLRMILYIQFTVSSLIVAFLPFISKFIFTPLFRIGMLPGMVLYTLFLLAPPLILLGATTPLLIRLGTSSLKESGTFSGYVFGVSTVSGIFATFLFGFYIVPHWGVSTTLLFTSLALFMMSGFLLLKRKDLLLFIPGLLLLVFGSIYHFSRNGKPVTIQGESVYRQEGVLGLIHVVDKKRISSNPFPAEENRYLYVNNIPQTCIINTPNAYSCSNYIHVMATFASLAIKQPPNEPARALLLGLGGGALAGELNRLGFSTDVVELDPRILSIASDLFYFDGGSTQFIIDDARHYLNTTKQKYDLVVFDIARGEVQPSYVFTKEGFQRLKRLLHPDGFFMIEYQGYAYGKKSVPFRSIYKTMQRAGYHTYTSIGHATGYGDIVVLGAPTPIRFGQLNKNELNACCRQQPFIDALLQKPITTGRLDLSKAVVLTDNKPMLESLSAPFLYEWRKDVTQSVLSIQNTGF